MIQRLLGFVLVVGCLAVVYLFESVSFGEGFWKVLHWPAIILTGLGPIAMIIMSYDWSAITRAVSEIFGDSFTDVQDSVEIEGQLLQKLAVKFYDLGPSVFEEVNVNGSRDTFIRMVEKLAVRVPMKDIKEQIELERERRRSKIIQSMNVVALGMKLAPSIGMLGTIMGMVRLLSTLQDPSEIGSHMSLALLTTFFGLFFSIVIWTPCAQKLERIMDLELDGYDQVLHWLETVEKRKPIDYFSEPFNLPQEKVA